MEGGQQTQDLGEGDIGAGGIEVAAGEIEAAAGGVEAAAGGVQAAAALTVEQEAAASGIISKPLPTSLKKPRRTSLAWKHFNDPVRNSAGELYASCKYCGTSYKCDPRTCGTSNLKYHAGKCARNPARNVDKSQGTIPYTSVPLGSAELFLHAWKFNQIVIRDALAKMLVVDELPFRFVQREGFTEFMKACCPQFKIPDRTTMKRDAHDLYKSERNKMLTFFRSKSPRVSLTTDTWTSGQQINYMCLTAHFIDEDWVLHKKIINFCQIHGHKGEDIGMTLEYCLREWGIDKVLAVTVDNASANEPAVQHLVRKFNILGTNVLSGRLMHMRCMAHIINLIVSDGMGLFLPSIDRIRAAVKFVRNSPSRLSRFKTCVIDCRLDTKALLTLDVCTRWNATYLMLLSAVKLEAAFEKYDHEDETFRKEMSKILKKGSKEPLGILCDHDWATVKSFLPFLKHFYDLTCRVSGSSYVTSNMFFEEMNDTFQLIKKGLMAGNDHHMISVAEKMKLKFDKYWADLSKINLLIFLASIFDPRNKLQVVKYGIDGMYDEHAAYALSLSVKDTLYEMFDEYVKLHSTDSIGEPNPQSSPTNLVEDDTRGSLLRAAFKKCKSSLDSVVKSELDKYLSEDVEEDVAKFNLLDWWKCNSPRFPILSIMARDILAIPISTVSSESAFSTAGRIVDDFRSSLTPRTIEALVYLQDWIRSSTSKITFVEDHKELEEFEAGLDAA